MKVRILFHTILLLLLTSCVAQEEETTKLSASYNGESSFTEEAIVRWGNMESLTSEIDLKVSESFTEEETEKIEEMTSQWDNAISEKFFVIPMNKTPNINSSNLADYNDNTIGIYKNNIWFETVDNSALAITRYSAIVRNSGTDNMFYQLIHADIIFNTKDHEFSIDENDETKYDLPSIVIHEIGHLLGLGHTAISDDSVMIPYIDTSTYFRSLSSLDISNLETNYTINDNSALLSSSKYNNAIKSQDIIVRGIIELKSDGSCFHHTHKLIE